MKRELTKKVFVAMSGGVDSSVAAALLKKDGYDVVGVHMKCWSQSSSDALGVGAPCAADQDLEDARRAAETLKIPFYVFDFEKEYKKKVVEYMVDGYRKGITPNPDVMCNKEIKFGLFLDKALSLGADYVATGHYVCSVRSSMLDVRRRILRAKRSDERSDQTPNVQLFRARDANKDQSYFLWTLTQKQLQHCLFPIGEYKKPEVRKLAKKFGLPNADKKDSQGVCFLGRIALKDFLGTYLPKKKGIVLDTGGRVMGEHEGAHFYTIGQRHLGIEHQASGASQKPLYVAEKAIKENAILVAPENDPALFRKEIKLAGVNFIDQRPTTNDQQQVLARIRYRQPLTPATLIISRKSSVVSCKLVFDRPQKFVASGQSSVFYNADGAMLGGGTII